MKRSYQIGVLALSLGLGATVFVLRPPEAKAETKPAPAPTARAALAVEAIRPVHQSWPLKLALNGPIAAWQEAIISAETGGLRIVALHAEVGSVVKRGQLLAELASDSVEANVRQQEANVASARASLAQAESNRQRSDVVKDAGSLSKQQIEQYQIAEQSARASLAAAQAALDSARITLSQTKVVAVDDGVISARSAALGSVVSTGTDLFHLVRQQRLEWRAEASGEQLNELKPGQRALLTLPGGSQVSGALRLVSPTLATDTRQAVAYVDIQARSAARAGMYVRGELELGKRDALTVPSSAVILRDGRSIVFEISKDKHVVLRQVVVGRQQGDRVEINKGIEPGVQLVKTGGAFLNDGDVVSLAGKASEAS
ncbi:efflux RND transporter periplasmic adaptor subunit [Chitinimonas naiadis]